MVQVVKVNTPLRLSILIQSPAARLDCLRLLNVNMAAATTTRSSFFTWPDEFRAEYYPTFALLSSSSPRTYRKYPRSISIGSSSTTKLESKPKARKSKSVHFADSKGLALVSVLTFDDEKELRNEFSKFMTLSRDERRTSTVEKCRSKQEDSVTGKSSETHFLSPKELVKQVELQKVCLEKTELLESAIRGTVCVHNLAYEKSVVVRYTFDEWRNQQDAKGNFHPDSSTKKMDKFVFEIPIPNESPLKNFKVEFAVCYTVLGDSFWDNNNGFNYHALFSRK